MKKFFITLAIVSAIFLMSAWLNSANAQNPSSHVITINTQYMIPTDSAGRAERTALAKEYFDKVTSKNQYIIHEWNMVHYYTDDSREWVTIDEFATWADIDKANDRFGELEKLAWPDAKARAAYFAKSDKYYSSHKDAIYHAVEGLSK